MTIYASIGDQRARELRFSNVEVHRSTQRGGTVKMLNNSLSRGLHATTFGTNPLAYVGPEPFIRQVLGFLREPRR